MADTATTTETDAAAAAETAAAATAAAETAAAETAATDTAAAETAAADAAAAAETAAAETVPVATHAEVQAELETVRAQLAEAQAKLAATEGERDTERSGRVNDRKTVALTAAAGARGAIDMDDVLGALTLDEIEEGKEADAIAALAARKGHWFTAGSATAVAAPVAPGDAIADEPSGESAKARAGIKLSSLFGGRS